MSEKIHVLARQLMGKPSVEECDLQELRTMVSRHPYFAPAQFLLLQKLKTLNDPEYGNQLSKSVLYYHNPLAFEYFIASDKFYTGEEIKTEPVSIADTTPATIPVESHENELTMPENEALPAGEPIATPEANVPLAENEALPVETEMEQSSQESDENISEPVSVAEPQEVVPQPAGIVPETEPLSAPSVSNESEKISTETPAEAAPALEFEPYHTVDYFASQGIRLSQEEITKDKFGQQLKSFTEWLKTMKRLPVKQTESSAETKVASLAENSVHNPEVVTETMAEVWLKQGNVEKAIETYNKLSLLNPSKKAYFAALIENLKRS